MEDLNSVEPDPDHYAFPSLPKLKVINMILSFYGFLDEVEKLMSRLSHESQEHFKDNEKQLKKTIVNWKPEITGLIDFGDQNEDWNNIYPTKEQIEKHPRDRLIKLKTIRYKEYYFGELSGIQFEFTNGIKTPMFETERAKRKDPLIELKTIEIDTSKTIGRICMKVSDGSYINGLRLVDNNGNYIVDVNWDEITNEGEWIEHEIPEGHEIIGI